MTDQGLPSSGACARETPPIRVFLVDDHDLVREGLAAILGREPDLEIAGEAASAEKALQRLPDAAVDVIIADVRLPGMDGMELCREIAERRIPGRVIILSAFMEDEVVYEAWLAGASGYVVKDVEAEPLKRAIRSVAEGRRVIDPKVAGTIAGWASRLELPSAEHLPPYLQRVLKDLCRGKTNEQIAASTGLTLETVKKYLGRIYKRLGARGRADAILEARRRGLT